ncbi:glycosyltransferase family 2 protein [Streptomyces sp. NPDC053048]|uniref:glycosyltransferase family 2 protein n=1 Tax=Streptomyces sp. NPDC053048 TaxID=3365694 RepID=UPI0037CF3695
MTAPYGTSGTGATPRLGAAAGIGVVIATRNRAGPLAATLGRLTTLPEAPRIVVVDNASIDGTPEMVRDCFPRVLVLRLPRDKGVVARTDGVRRLRTPLIAFSDDDSWWAPGALARAEALMREHPRLGLLSARVLVGADRRPHPLDDTPAASPLGRAPDLPGPSVLGFPPCAAVVRREAYLQTGGFSRLLSSGGAESVLAYDLAARGWGLAHCPDVVAHHCPAVRPCEGHDARMARDALLTAWLRRPLPLALRRTLAVAVRVGHDRVARHALCGTLSRLPAALAHRRPVPSGVEADIRLLERHTGGDGRGG